jgi:thiol-disulfide isomerase/thioredoxin
MYSMRFFTPALVFVLALALAGGVWLSQRPSYAPTTAVVLLDGSTRLGAAVPGQVTLVNFWATSCSVCVAEMPQMARLFQTYRAQGFSTVAVAMAYDPPAMVIRFSESRQLPFDVVIDNTGALAQAWGDVQATPTSYLVNRRGEIVERLVGAPDFEALSRKIEALLRDTAAASAHPGAGAS